MRARCMFYIIFRKSSRYFRRNYTATIENPYVALPREIRRGAMEYLNYADFRGSRNRITGGEKSGREC